jgi:two-component system phosphate regulon sensor histidine kinase PhoR
VCDNTGAALSQPAALHGKANVHSVSGRTNLRVNSILGRAALVIGLSALACLIVWPIAGAAAALGLFAATLLALVWLHLRHLALLLEWLRDPTPETVPHGVGAWDEAFAAFYRLLRQQRQSESRLTARLNDFQQAGEAIPDGLVILDQADRIEWCNPEAERHFGIDRQRDTGQGITYLVRHPQFAANLQSRNYSEPLVMRQWRGNDLTLSVQLVPYGDRQKLVVSRDITELERVETMRRDFIANVSHELRTPLTVLCGFLETIADGEAADSELLRRSLPLMAEQARRMQRLVEDLLTLSRLESAGNPLREERVNVPDLVRALYRDALALSAGRHRITLNIESDAWLGGSEDELRSAFSNLISNAVRYTPKGGEVDISWRCDERGAALSVRDTGIGIEPRHIARLTERFYRVDRSRSRESGGTGLGLAIVKHVLNRHQGRLEIASEPDRGSTFTALFPAQRLLTPEHRAALAHNG